MSNLHDRKGLSDTLRLIGRAANGKSAYLLAYKRAQKDLCSMFCEHTKRIGDNYGISCQDCQAVLEGYGFGGFFGSNLKGNERCIHGAWYTVSDAEEECLYCHTTRERAQQAN